MSDTTNERKQSSETYRRRYIDPCQEAQDQGHKGRKY